MVDGRDLPYLKDDAISNVWDNWGPEDRDLFFIRQDGWYHKKINLNSGFDEQEIKTLIEECLVCEDDSSCGLSARFYGCLDKLSCNYSSAAIIDDRSCESQSGFCCGSDPYGLYCDCDGTVPQAYCYDTDGDGTGNGNVSFYCAGNEPDGWVIECSDCDGTYGCDGICYDEDAPELDGCGVCSGDNADQDCAGNCFGSATLDNCDTCDNIPYNDCIQDCDGIWGGDNNSCLSINPLITPDTYNITHIYPNPFNPTTLINYGLPESENIRISVYDITGKEVAILLDSFQSRGYYSIRWNALSYPSGIYFIKLISDHHLNTQKVILIK